MPHFTTPKVTKTYVLLYLRITHCLQVPQLIQMYSKLPFFPKYSESYYSSYQPFRHINKAYGSFSIALTHSPCLPAATKEVCLLTVYFIVFMHMSYLLHISPYTLFAYIWRARNIFLSLMMSLIGESLEFSFYS